MAKMSDKHKMMAYVLNKEMGYTQNAIATLMKVSQSTVANMCKEISFRVTINNLERDLQEARMLIQESGLLPEKPILYIE